MTATIHPKESSALPRASPGGRFGEPKECKGVRVERVVRLCCCRRGLEDGDY